MKNLKIQIKGHVMMLLMVFGANYIYTYIWMLLALPVSWWTSWLLAILSALSAWGVIVWIGRD